MTTVIVDVLKKATDAIGLSGPVAAGVYQAGAAVLSYLYSNRGKAVELKPEQAEAVLNAIAEANGEIQRLKEAEKKATSESAELRGSLATANAQNQQLREGATKTASQNYRLKVAVATAVTSEIVITVAALLLWSQRVNCETREV